MLKFTERGSVTLHAGGRGARCASRCATAAGITAGGARAALPALRQADQSTTRRFGGSGLGLSICHELAALMGGRVGVDSTPGEGSRFWAELPLPAAEATAAMRRPAPGCFAAGRRRARADGRGQPVNMTIAVAMLEQWGVQVEQASDGRRRSRRWSAPSTPAGRSTRC